MIKNLKKAVITSVFSLCLYGAMSHNAFGAVYTVVNGDSVYKISKIFNTSVSNIINDNKLKSPQIYPGQKLNVNSRTYKVKSGDTLYLISKTYNTTVRALKIANSYIPDMLNVGQVINIPPALSVTVKPAPVTTPPVVTTTNMAPPVASTASKYSQSDIDLLARLIMAEAQGESFNAKVAVGAVVLNRVKSSIFPSTIKDVIYEVDYGYYQFTPVLNGWINRTADEASIAAAYAAINGNDPTNGALYYFDTSITNKWLLSKPVSVQIGNLVFAM